jgi:hypothetical protein
VTYRDNLSNRIASVLAVCYSIVCVGAEVSGRAFLGLIRHAKDQRAYLDRIIEDAGSEARSAFAKRIRQTDWYPYTAYVGLLRALERHLGPGDATFFRTLGSAAGTRDLGSMFRVYAALASPERLIRACGKIWPSYYRNAGRMEAITWTSQDTTLRIFDFAEMDRRHCRLMEGWMIGTMTSIGVRVNDDARETACTSKGAPHHEFRCSWSRK